MSRFVRWTAATAAALLLAGCSGGTSDGGDDKGAGTTTPASTPSSTTPSSRASPGLPASLTSQKLDWGRCKGTSDSPTPGSDWQCATLKVPLDYAKADGETIGLSLIRARASGENRIGSLLFNFGGPGQSGVSVMPSYAGTVSALGKRYDLVSWDPRGVGASEGVRCRSDKEIRAAESVDPSPDDAAEEKAYFEDAASFGKGCESPPGTSSRMSRRPTPPATWT